MSEPRKITIREAEAQLQLRQQELVERAREINRTIRISGPSAFTRELIAAYNADVVRYRARRDEIKKARELAANRRENAAEAAAARENACPRCFTVHPGDC